jgi:PAS domain S-box-containing protein
MKDKGRIEEADSSDEGARLRELRRELEEAQETLRAIRSGEVDALLVEAGEDPRIFTINGSNQAYRVLFETLNEGALTISGDGTVLFANPRFVDMVGVPLEQVLGASLRSFLRIDDGPGAGVASDPAIDALFRAGVRGSSKREVTLVRADGSTMPAMASLKAARLDGVEDACTVVVTDLTELKQAQEDLRRAHAELEERVRARTAELSRANAELAEEIAERRRLTAELRRRNEELAEADRRKDEFLSMLAHELRNPLAPILNSARALDMMHPEGAAQRRHTAVIERQIRNLSRLVDDLLDVARITRGAITLSTETVRLQDIVPRAVDATRALIDGLRHELSVALPDEPTFLEADPTRLEQILVNLLINAAKYSEPGSRIHLSAEHEGGDVIVRLKDTGLGIPADLLPHIFSLFVQGQRSIDRSQGGLGIGLTLVKSLVEMHRGAISAHSEGAGKGTEIEMRFPRAPAPPEAQADAAAPQPDVVPVRVLIVEDNVDAAETLAEVLELSGHEVVVTHTGQAATEAARAKPPQVVLCDLGLPGMDGYEVAQRMRALPSMEDALLVALTGYGQVEDRRRTREAGFHVHLTKPVEPEHLARLLTMAKAGSARLTPAAEETARRRAGDGQP